MLAIKSEIANSCTFNPTRRKKSANAGMYKMEKRKTNVNPIAMENSLFLYFNVSKMLYLKERLVKLNKMLAKIKVVNTIARVVGSSPPFCTVN